MTTASLIEANEMISHVLIRRLADESSPRTGGNLSSLVIRTRSSYITSPTHMTDIRSSFKFCAVEFAWVTMSLIEKPQKGFFTCWPAVALFRLSQTMRCLLIRKQVCVGLLLTWQSKTPPKNSEFRNDKLKNKQGRRAVAKAHAKVKQMKRIFFLVSFATSSSSSSDTYFDISWFFGNRTIKK